MTITIPDDAIGNLHLTSEEARIELAVGLFASHRATLGRAASIAGLPRLKFQHQLAQRKISVHYDVAEFESDLITIAEMPGK